LTRQVIKAHIATALFDLPLLSERHEAKLYHTTLRQCC
jgi:hypothetical protein